MFANVTLSLMGGFVTTVQLFCLTLVFALPLGLLISFGSMSRITPLRALIKIIVWMIFQIAQIGFYRRRIRSDRNLCITFRLFIEQRRKVYQGSQRTKHYAKGQSSPFPF